WQPCCKHERSELVGLAVHVDKTARKMRAHQGKSAVNHAGDEFIDEAVFRAPQGGDIEPAGREEIARVGRAGVRRIEHHRALTRLGLEDFVRRIKLVADFAHEIQAIGRFGYRGVGRALTPRYTVYCSWLGHKAKPCFWFTRYLPGISLNGLAETAKGRPDGVLSGGVEWLCPKSSWLKTTPICGAFWSRRCKMPAST